MASTGILPPIVCISPIDWDFLWQQQQILMAGFARRGAQVAFVEKLDAGRPAGMRDWRRLAARARSLWRQATQGDRMVRNVRVVTPAVVPAGVASALNERVTLPRLAARLGRVGFRTPIVWTYSGAPNASTLEHLLVPGLLVYHCVNRIRGYRYATEEMIAAEEALCRRADLVIADAKILVEEKRVLNPRCMYLPSGVEFELFAPYAARPEPVSLAALPRPRIGFFGNIDDRLDQPLLARFAGAHSSWSVVLIGPANVDLSALRALPNVVMVGAVPHHELGAWLQGIDVIVIPYRVGEFTRGIMPAKLFESLATGKPVVSTGLPELESYRPLVHCCEPETFAATVERAVEADTPTARVERIGLARTNSWESRLDQAQQWLAEAWEVRQRDPARATHYQLSATGLAPSAPS